MKKRFNKFLTLLAVLLFGFGQVWAADPLDTYYTFPDTKTTGQTVSPVSGESNDITVGTAGVAASAYTFAGTAYTNGLKLGNSTAKGATLNIPGSTANPAHVFIVCSGSNKDVYLELSGTKKATGKAYSSVATAPGVIELVVTESGNYNLYASGDVFCYEIRILYEKNTNIVKTYKSGVAMSVTGSSTWNSDLEELFFFKPMEVTVDKDNKRYTFSGTASAPNRRTITFTAQANGSLAVGLMCTSTSNRNVMLKTLSSGSFSDALATSANIKNGATTSLEYASITSGTTYVLVASGADIHVTSIVFTPAAVTNYTVTIDPNGGSYASTPEGWTLSDGKYTKSIASGTSFSAPDGLSKGTDDLSWKDGSDNDVTFPVTISGDITFVAQWTAHTASSDATLSDLKVGGVTVTGFAAGTTEYNVELPFGTTVVPTVAGTANDANAKSVEVTQASSVTGSATVVVTAEDNSTTKTYTINFSVATSKLIDLVWKTGQSACDGAGSQAAVIKSNNASVSTYIKAITFANVEGTGDDAAEGGSLNTGKKAGNTIIIQTQPGYLFTTMSFYGKIESEDTKCLISVDGGTSWNDLESTSTGDALYCNVVTGASTNDIRIKSAGVKGTWIRNMQLTITTGCSPVVVTWNEEPVEFEVGATGKSIAATANNSGTITYGTSDNAVVAVNASTGALTISALGSATLSASTPEGDGTTYCANGGNPIVINKAVNTYYLVQFDPQNETAVVPVKYYDGDPAIALPAAPSYSGFDFQGWFDAATGGNQITEAITPTESMTVYAQWVAQCAGPTITTQPVGANYLTGRAATALNCEATAGAGGALTYTWYSCDDAMRTNPVELAGAPTPSTAAAGTFYFFCAVTEEGCDKIAKSNVVTITVTDKDMLCLISVTIPNGTGSDQEIEASNISGYVGGTANQKLEGGKHKLGSKGHYIGITLATGTFQENDVVKVKVEEVTADKMRVFNANTASEDNVVASSSENMTTGWNVVNIAYPDESTTNSLYLRRGTDDENYQKGWNPFIGAIAVYRAYPAPIMTAITIDGASGSISGTAVNVTIPAVSDLESLTVVPTFISNDPTQTNGNVISNEGAWALGENTYRVTDKDGDYTDYTISLAKDVAIESVTISGETTLAAKSQITLTATVLPAAAINKNVTWTSSDETKATVDANGVVTGKAAGNVTITATSVADNTKYGTHDITVTKFIGTEYAYWFAKAADATANGVANDDGTIFEGAPTDGSNLSASLTMEVSGVETTYTVTRRSGDDGFGTFHVPADFTANLYMLVIGSGSPRTLTLKETSTNAEYASTPATFGDQATQIVFENIPSGNYSFDKHSQSIRLAVMVAELNSYPLTSVSIEEGFNLRLGTSRTPVITANPAKAAIVSQEWSIVSQTGATDAELNTTTGVITAGTEEGTMTVKVTVTDVLGNELASGNCVVNIVNIIDQQPVTGSVTWDWNALSMSKTTITDEEVLVLANYINGDKWAMLKGTKGDNAYSTNANGSYEGKGTLSFTTTVPGLVTITARSWNNSPNLKIGDQAVINSLSGSTKVSKPFFVPAGEVVISASNENDGMRIMKIEFDADLTADKVAGSFFEGYTRNVTEGRYGTICLPTNGVMIGATVYTLAFYGATSQKIFFDEVVTGRMEAGKPYLFLPEQGVTELKVFYTDSETKAAQAVNGFHGYIGDSEAPEDALQVVAGEGNYIVQNNTYREVQAGAIAYILSHRAYINFGEIDPKEPALAPGARRIGLGKDAAQGFENLQSGDQPMKVMIDGTLYIIRGEKVYNANGQVVK